MIRKKINQLLYERELSKRFKTDLMYADIFRLEDLQETHEAKSVDFGNAPKFCNIVGILDDESKLFYPLFTDEFYIVKKKNHTERLSYDSLNQEDIGGYFILNIKNFDINSLEKWELRQYYREYKRLMSKHKSDISQINNEKCNVKVKC